MQTPDEIAARLIDENAPPGLVGYCVVAFESVFATALRDYGAACAAEMKERCRQAALELGWRSDASDALQIAATTITAAIRELPIDPPQSPAQSRSAE